MDYREMMTRLASEAAQAARKVAIAGEAEKNRFLTSMADALREKKDKILEANGRDLQSLQKKDKTAAFIDRLTLNEERIIQMGECLREVASLPDPVGRIPGMWLRPNGLYVGRMRVPLGVVAIIYESRPNVTSDAIGLCLKSGNAVILRGGSESFHSNMAIADIAREALSISGLTPEAVRVVPVADREAVLELLRLDEHIDVVIPRGGEGLIRMVVENSTIPVIKHYKGLCHTYVDLEADMTMAEDICFNAKVQRPGVCNAMETLLVHRDIAGSFLPGMLSRFMQAGVEIRGCPETRRLFSKAKEATEEDYATEYLDLIISVKVVNSYQEAADHIARYGSGHSEAIITRNCVTARRFVRETDASAVFVNSSTRFNDGNELGLGAEIGISTQKLHSRGPMGLEDLTCQKYIVFGEGQVRE